MIPDRSRFRNILKNYTKLLCSSIIEHSAFDVFVDFQDSENDCFLRKLSGLKFLNISGSRNLVRKLNSTLLQNCTDLETLDMSNLHLCEPSGDNDTNFFKRLSNLKTLFMQNVIINGQDVNNSFYNGSWLPKLSFVDLKGAVCKHCDLWYMLGTGQNLSQIDLSLSEDFPLNFTSLNLTFSGLENLNLFRGAFTEIDLSGFEKLEALNMSGVRANHVKLSGLSKLEFLNFSQQLDSCEEAHLCDFQTTLDVLELSDMNNLTWIHFSQIKVKKVVLENLPKLEGISFSSASIEMMSLNNLKALKILDLSNRLPSHSMNLTLNNLPSLEELNLSKSSSPIDKIFIQNLPKLEKIHLFNVSVRAMNLESLESLTFLNFSQSTNSKMRLSNLPTLNELHLSNSTLQKIWMTNATNLTNLDLSFITDKKIINQFHLSQFKNLASLNLSSCELFEVPDNLMELEFLRSLDLSRNFFTTLPQKFLPPVGKCKLVNLDFSHNFLDKVSLEAIRPMIDPYTCWEINLENNVLNCSECQNSWMSDGRYAENIEGALCQTPFDKYHVKVQDIDICDPEDK